MIRIAGLTARYAGAAVDVLHDLSLSAVSGTLSAVVGPNGSGKSSIVRAILGRLPVSVGAIQLDDRLIDAWSPAERARRLAVVVQREEPAFPTQVEDYVALGRQPFRGAWGALRASDRDAIQEAIHSADIGMLAGRTTDTLSGGEWQRVRLARALAQQPATLIVDEPTTFLDIAHEMACFEMLSALAAGGCTVLVVSHQLNLVARFAGHVVLLSAGRVAAAGTAEDVMRGATLERVYQWPLVITRDPAVGAPALVPLRRPR